MKKSKEKFQYFRRSTKNHADRNRLAYLKQTNADQEQINHVTGLEVVRWK
jgi:hypothetical protein